MKSLLRLKSGVLLATLLVTHTALAERIERETAAAADGEVQIVNVSGEVRVIGWNQPQVKLLADLEHGADEVEFERNGDVTRIRVKGSRDHANDSNLTVHVPHDSTLIIRTVSASQTIEGVRGEQRLQSVSGSIRTTMAAEDLEAKTVSGEIHVTGSGKTASSRVTTVSGEIHMDKVAGEFELSSVSGAIDLRAGTTEEARVNTTNGEIRIASELTADGRIEAEAINGSIEVNLRGKVDTQFDVESFNGSINNCFGPKPRRASEYGPGIVLRFSEGEAEARVRLKTLNGEIALCRK